MAVRQMGVTVGGNIIQFTGLSTDTKPIIYNNKTPGNGSTFYEFDTQNSFMFDGVSTWWPC